MTFFQFLKKFPTEISIINHYIKIRYKGDKVSCHHCGGVRLTHLKDRPKNFKCHSCNNMFSIFKGTIFEKSDTDLVKWFFAIHLFLNGKKGISALQLQREIGTTYKCAWRILRKIREAMGNDDNNDDNDNMLSGMVEMDECYIGGKSENKHMNKRITQKEKRVQYCVFGMLERDRRIVKAMKVDSAKYHILGQKAIDNINSSSTIITDEFKSYTMLRNFFKEHKTINHSQDEYKKGSAYTNSIENFWATLKRGIYGIYHKVSNKYLDNYVNEFCFRYNNRSNKNIFDSLLERTILNRNEVELFV